MLPILWKMWLTLINSPILATYSSPIDTECAQWHWEEISPLQHLQVIDWGKWRCFVVLYHKMVSQGKSSEGSKPEKLNLVTRRYSQRFVCSLLDISSLFELAVAKLSIVAWAMRTKYTPFNVDSPQGSSNLTSHLYYGPSRDYWNPKAEVEWSCC